MAPGISSRRNPLGGRLRSLASRKGREEQSLLLLEGTHLLKEALKTPHFPREIVATSAWLQGHSELLESLPIQTPIISLWEFPSIIVNKLLITIMDKILDLDSILLGFR